MPLQKLSFKPGVNRENTRYTQEGAWWDMDRVRFRSGTAESIGGWTQLGANNYLGVARLLHNWVTLAGENLLAVGTNLKMYIERGQGFFDITPIRYTVTLTNPFTTGTAGTATITVVAPLHGALNGDFVTFSGASALDGISATLLNGEFQISIVNPNIFTFTAPANCTAGSVNGGGSVTVAFQPNTGATLAATGTGWGAPTWGGTTAVPLGANPFTTVSAGSNVLHCSVPGHSAIVGDKVTFAGVSAAMFDGISGAALNAQYSITGIVSSSVIAINALSTATAGGVAGGGSLSLAYLQGWGMAAKSSLANAANLHQWVGSNFGQDFVYSIRDGAIYYWTSTGNITTDLLTRGVTLSSLPGASDAPTVAGGILVTDDQHVVALGTNYAGSLIQTPLLVRWCAQGNPLNWTPAITNTAGDMQLTAGSYIYTARKLRQENLIWTDTSVISMQFVGPPVVFSFTPLATNISIASSMSVAVAQNVAYWMGKDKFYKYDGQVQTLNCDVRKFVFSGMNQTQLEQVHAGTNEQFNEVTWWYCSTNSLVPDRYVTFNYVENLWTFGSMVRTAWLDSPLRSNPVAAGTDTKLYYHESGFDDGSTSPPVSLNSFIESADFDIGEGDRFSLVSRILPDVDFDSSTSATPNVTLTIKARDYPGSNFTTAQTKANSVSQTAVVPFLQFTEAVYVRVRGRQLSFRLDCNTAGTTWQMGTPRIDLREDGGR